MNKIFVMGGLVANAILLALCVILALWCMPSGLAFFDRAGDVYSAYGSLSLAAVTAIPLSGHVDLVKGAIVSWVYLCATAGLGFLAAAGVSQVYARVSDFLALTFEL